MIDESTLKAFMDLFNGRKDRWGGIIEKPDGTKSGVSNPGPVTEKHYKEHLEGKTSIGIYHLLDDGTVNFFTIDLDWHDEKKHGKPDFGVALKVQAFFEKEFKMPIYIANSKSLLGFHLYGFFTAPVPAVEIRKICIYALKKLDLSNTEIFPKQDKIDPPGPTGTVKYGNYINIPYFGDSPRRFLTKDQKMLNLNEALPLLQRIDTKLVTEVANEVHKQNTIEDIDSAARNSSKAGKAKKPGKYPPCIQNLLNGVDQGMRDIAAFTLASHYITDQGMSPDDALVHLMKWNEKNKPPMSEGDLADKIKSVAGKGYDIGCSKIQNDTLLAHLCVGEANCAYIQAVNKEKIKAGLIQFSTFFETETHLYEEIIMNGKPMFASYER